MEYVIGGMRVDWYSSGRQGQKVEEKKMGRECHNCYARVFEVQQHWWTQGRIKTKLGLMLQRKKVYFFSTLVHVQWTFTVHAHPD